VIESRSLGMKGTYLRILNPEIRKEFENSGIRTPKHKVPELSRTHDNHGSF